MYQLLSDWAARFCEKIFEIYIYVYICIHFLFICTYILETIFEIFEGRPTYQLSDWAAQFCEKIGSRNLLTDRQQRPDEIQISNVQGFQQKFF